MWRTTGRGKLGEIQNRVRVASGCELWILQNVVRCIVIEPEGRT